MKLFKWPWVLSPHQPCVWTVLQDPTGSEVITCSKSLSRLVFWWIAGGKDMITSLMLSTTTHHLMGHDRGHLVSSSWSFSLGQSCRPPFSLPHRQPTSLRAPRKKWELLVQQTQVMDTAIGTLVSGHWYVDIGTGALVCGHWYMDRAQLTYRPIGHVPWAPRLGGPRAFKWWLKKCDEYWIE